MRVVFLHGIGGQADGFSTHVAWFKTRGFDAIALNQPGYGGIDLVEPYQFSGIADRLILALQTRHLGRDAMDEPTVLVGHSMGGMLAQTVAIRNSGRPVLNLVGLVLAQTSPAFGRSDGDFQQRFIAARTAPLDAGQSMAEVAAALIPTMVGPNCSAAVKNACAALMGSVPALTYRAALSALVAFDARPMLGQIALPVLCLAAEHDTTAPPAVLETLAKKLPNAQFQCLPALGHLAPMENPTVFCEAVFEFLKTIE
jgi:3-oxoadipate enol-lactonase